MRYDYEFGSQELRQKVVLETKEEHFTALRGLTRLINATTNEDEAFYLEDLRGEVAASHRRLWRSPAYEPLPFYGDDMERIERALMELVCRTPEDAEPVDKGFQAAARYMFKQAGGVCDVPLQRTPRMSAA